MDTPGHPPGVAPGASFRRRTDLAAARVHLPQMHDVAVCEPRAKGAAAAGPEGFAVATSLVIGNSGMRARATQSAAPTAELRIYRDSDAETSMEVAGLAMSLALKSPVRVCAAHAPDLAAAHPQRGYVYQGLFQVTECRMVPAAEGERQHAFAFTLLGIPGHSIVDPPQNPATRAQHAASGAAPPLHAEVPTGAHACARAGARGALVDGGRAPAARAACGPPNTTKPGRPQGFENQGEDEEPATGAVGEGSSDGNGHMHACTSAQALLSELQDDARPRKRRRGCAVAAPDTAADDLLENMADLMDLVADASAVEREVHMHMSGGCSAQPSSTCHANAATTGLAGPSPADAPSVRASCSQDMHDAAQQEPLRRADKDVISLQPEGAGSGLRKSEDAPAHHEPVHHGNPLDGTQPDPQKRAREQAALLQPQFPGEFLPTYRNVEALLALGVDSTQLFPAMFSDLGTYKLTQLQIERKVKARMNRPHLLSLKAPSSCFEEPARCGLDLQPALPERVAPHWPAHPQLKQYLHVRPELRYSQSLIDGCRTREDQQQLLTRCAGWEAVFPNGRYNADFETALDQLLHLNMFGISFAEMSRATYISVMAGFAVFKSAAEQHLKELADPNDVRHGPIDFSKAIPKTWRKQFPRVYVFELSQDERENVLLALAGLPDWFLGDRLLSDDDGTDSDDC